MELALKLHISLKELSEMTYEEILLWFEYFNQYPDGWQEDLRTWHIMQASAFSEIKKKPEEIFPRLKPIFNKDKEAKDKGQISLANLENSPMYQSMLNAKGGKIIE
jgi:hypothetical protein